MNRFIGMIILFWGIISATEISFNLELLPSQLSLVPKDTFTFVSIGGFEYENKFGAPMLPIISKKFCIPTNEAVVSYNITAIDSIVVPGQYLIFPVQPPEPMAGGIFYPPDSLIYHSASPFPEEIVNFYSPHYMAGVKTIDVLIYPVRYEPALKKLMLYTRLEIKLILGPSPGNACPVVKRSLAQHQDILNSAKIVVDNPDQVEPFTASPPIVPDSLFSSERWPPGPSTFMIITTTDMVDEFQVLADWRVNKGLRARIVTKEWIENNYPGRDIQEKIREYIKYAYSNLGTQYILIGGDQEIIPTRIAYAGLGNPSYDNVPSDLYYSDLEGYWDGDWDGAGPAADNIFCWFTSHQFFTDSIDFDPDVSVGRISVSTEIEAQQFINKLLTYELNPDEYQGTTDFLLLGSYMGFNISGGEIKDSCVADISPTISCYGLYDDYYHGTTPHSRIGPDMCIEYLSNGFYLINHAGHGGFEWIYVDPVHPFDEALSGGDIQNLNNIGMWSLMYSLSCASADFSYPYGDCFGEWWLSAGTGAAEKGLIAYLGHTKAGWFSIPGTACSDILDRYFFRILTHCEYPRRGTNIIGLALSLAKLDLPNVWDLDRYEHTSLNALADPTTPAWVCKPLVITASHPTEIAVNRWVDLTVTVSDENGFPIVEAVVCLNKINDIYEIATTNSSGQVVFHIYANATGTINVTVSKTMYIPSKTAIEVRSGFWSDDPLALAYNGNRHLVRKPSSEELHLVYTDGGQITYLFSSNGGLAWASPVVIGEGSYPAITLDRTGLPSVVWKSDGAVGYRRQIAQAIWGELYFLSPPLPYITSPPALTVIPSPTGFEDEMHALITNMGEIIMNGVAHVVIDLVFPINHPEQYVVDVIEYCEGPMDSLFRTFPSIAKDFQNRLHAVWQRVDTICYATRDVEQPWNNWGPQFEANGLQSAHPFVECYGDSCFVVWQRKESPSMQEEIYRVARYLDEPFLNWNNLSMTPSTPSLYPTNASGSFTFYADIPVLPPDEEYEIYYKVKSEDIPYNISQSPNIWSLFPHSDVMFVSGGTYFYLVWLEGDALLPYEIRFKTMKPPEIERAYLSSLNGYATPSPYLIQRDSLISDWQIPVDIGEQSIIYQFPLEPGYRYKIKAVAYHESSDEWREWIKIDNKMKHLIKYNACEPETLELWIPPPYYQDSIIEVTFDRIFGDYATIGPLLIYQYEYLEVSEGGGPMACESQILKETSLDLSPNPFTRTLILNLQSTSENRVSIKVYDTSGRLVRQWHNQTMRQSDCVVWDAKDDTGRKRPAGVYFVKLEAGDEAAVQKAVLLR